MTRATQIAGCRTGKQQTKLAMTGMHVVGSTAGHPEMIWATFEHLANAPNDAYSYRNAGGGVTSITRDTAGTWLFAPANSTGPFNQPRNALDSSGNIIAVSANGVGPDTVAPNEGLGAAF